MASFFLLLPIYYDFWVFKGDSNKNSESHHEKKQRIDTKRLKLKAITLKGAIDKSPI